MNYEIIRIPEIWRGPDFVIRDFCELGKIL